MQFAVQMGALLDAPIYYEHKRARNWLANVELDPHSPGGLKRDFWERGQGKFLYMVPNDLKLNQAIEFGSDYYSASGKQSPERWHGKIIGISDTHLTIEQCVLEDLFKQVEKPKTVCTTIGIKPPYELQLNENGYWERLIRVNVKDEARIAFDAFSLSKIYMGAKLRVLDKTGKTVFKTGNVE